MRQRSASYDTDSRLRPLCWWLAPTSELSGVVESNDHVVAVQANGVASDAEPIVHEGAACRDFEFPLVPRTTDDALGLPDGKGWTVGLDGCSDPARAEGRATVGAAVGEGVEGSGDAVQADAVAAHLEH